MNTVPPTDAKQDEEVTALKGVISSLIVLLQMQKKQHQHQKTQ